MLTSLLSTLVSCSRIDALLEEEETAKYSVVATPCTAGDPKIGFVNATFTWNNAQEALDDASIFKLSDLNLRFALDGLNLVVGSVGCVSEVVLSISGGKYLADARSLRGRQVCSTPF